MTRLRLAVTAGIWLVLWLGLWAGDASPAVLLLGAVVAAVAGTIFVSGDLVRSVCTIEWTRRPAALPSDSADDPLVTSLRRQIHGAVWSGSTQLHDTLVETIDERLLVHHQIRRTDDPAAATAVLTPRLRRLLASQRRREVTPNELQQILSDIESL
jgi:hypothetical protein